MSAQPDYAVSPGDFLRDWLEENSTTQLQLANDIGVSRKHIHAILEGATFQLTLQRSWRWRRATRPGGG